ncbi:hypothetical protein [Oricola cellulosilytica]|uniref:PLxRFG domain-containing protein n=1 Tax=Oricola cellulosilytica TaxID=1429082 RepID=A0A4R0PCE5_9HYPH|nr:hypothetical protein [Oricola cellulosilytica]TCD15142.1 hypothetical protein E0D97_06225 [Oricola cellulosilytica]
MSIQNCLNEAVRGGELSKQEAERLKRDFERFRKHRAAGGDALADEQARLDLLQSLKADTAQKRRRAKIALQNIREIENDFFTHRNAAGNADIAEAGLLKLEHFGNAAFSSVAGRQGAITGMAHAKMESVLHHFRRGALAGDAARHNAADLRNVLREAFGEDTGDMAAKGLAKAWRETHEWLRARFNAAGGAIGELENWGLPQHHDARALRNAGIDTWKETIRPMLDVERMTHPLTGARVDSAELDAILDDIYYSITTEGWIDRKPARLAAGRGALAGQRAEHRFLVFHDPDTWLQYQTFFGGGSDPFAAMMGHVNLLARDIAAMEVLGPNPNGTIEWIKQAITKEAQNAAAGRKSRIDAKPQRALDRAKGANKRIDDVWASLRGALETPVGGRSANVAAAARSLITASVLGSAAISSISDAGTSIIARRFAGISSKGAIADIMKHFGSMNRREAVAAGLILDSAQHVFHAQARYVGTLQGPQWASYLADRVLTLSGLTPWTQAARHAFGMAFQHELANHAKSAFADLPKALRGTLERHGMTSRQWDMLRKAPLHRNNGAAFLRPAEIADRIDPKLAERYLEIIQAETEFAVPNGSHRSKTVMRENTRPGTFLGEVVRSFTQFKSFGAVFILLHGMRIHAMAAGREYGSAAAYAGSLLLSTTLFGAAALQIKQVAAGRDPRDMTDPESWGAALLQGGGLGIYGDFLFSNVNRYGGGFSTTLAGPLVQRANDFWNLTAGNAIQLATGEKTHFGRELVRFARGNVPGGNIWYLRLAFERTVLDQLQFLADPEANKAFKRQQRFWQREFGQEFWWKPGTAAPQRGPDIGAIAGS